MIANLMGTDLVFVILIAVLVLGFGSQLPKIARNLGSAGREFRKAQQEAEEEAEREKAAKAARDAATPPPVPLPPAPAPTGAVPPGGAAATAGSAGSGSPSAGVSGGEQAISLTPAQLEALLKAREDQVRNQSGPQN